MLRTSTPGISSRAICSVSAHVLLSSTIRTSLDMSGQEAISHFVQREEMPGAVGIRFQLLPQPHYMGIHGPRIRKRFVTPDGIENHIARERAVGIVQEKC